MVAHWGAVVRHSSEILLVVILRPEFVRSPPLGVMMVPETEMQGSVQRPKPDPHPLLHRPLSHSRTLPRDSQQTLTLLRTKETNESSNQGLFYNYWQNKCYDVM